MAAGRGTVRAARAPANREVRVASWILAFARMTCTSRARGSVAHASETPAEFTRAIPVIAQWQGGAVKAVFPKAAAAEGVGIVNLPRS